VILTGNGSSVSGSSSGHIANATSRRLLGDCDCISRFIWKQSNNPDIISVL
jgi:hypothetical protein